MRAQHHPAQRGLAWIAGGLALYRKRPFALATNVMMASLLLIIASVFILPVLTVGLFKVCRMIERDEPVLPGAFFSGLQKRPGHLLILGLLCCAFSLLSFVVGNWFDGGLLAGIFGKARAINDPVFQNPALMRSILFRMAIFFPGLALCGFAPPITALHNASPIKAVFFSIIAFWRNMTPIIVGGLAFFALLMFLPITLAVVVSVISPVLGATVYLVALFALVPLAWSTFYVATHDIFPELWNAPAA